MSTTYSQELEIFYSQVIIVHFVDWVESFTTLSDSHLPNIYFWALSSLFTRLLYCILICQFSNYHKIMSYFIKWWLLLQLLDMVMYVQNQEYKWISLVVPFLLLLDHSLFMVTMSILYGMSSWFLWKGRRKIKPLNFLLSNRWANNKKTTLTNFMFFQHKKESKNKI